MRAVASRYAAQLQPAIAKKVRAKTAHISPPTKGLSIMAQTGEADTKSAGVLTNFYVDEDRIFCRPGYVKIATMPGGAAVDHLIPYYGAAEKLAAATNHTLCDAGTGTVWKTGFTSNDWHWTTFTNLGEDDYTVLVNGADGVWSWDGTPGSTDPAPVVVTNLSKGNPAVCTVAAGDIGQFHNDDVVMIAGAVGTGLVNANGPHRIDMVGSPANTFTLVGVDTSAAAAAQTSGVTADPPSTGFVKEVLTAPTGASWLDPDSFHVTLAHMNRLWFADQSNLCVYYLPIQQKSGELSVVPLNAVFKRGGSVRAIATWTVDGGMGLDDQLVIFTTNGECAIYSGIDPDSDLGLVGVYRIEPPLSKHCVVNYGGELYVLIPTGVTPMTAMIKAGKEGLDTVDKQVSSIFLRSALAYVNNKGWELFLNPSSGRLFANIPLGAGRYEQMVRHMPQPVWTQFKDIPAHCWAWLTNTVYFGDDNGNVYQSHPRYQSDDGRPINVDVQMAWSQFKTPNLKHFKMILPYIVTDGSPRPYVDVKVDYDATSVINQPEPSEASLGGAEWDIAEWDVDDWVGGNTNWSNWTGVGSLGRVGAVRLTASIANCSFAVTGFDVLFEEGSVFG